MSESVSTDVEHSTSFFDNLSDPDFDDNALTILRSRYLLRTEDRVIETPKELLWRVAIFTASAEALYAPELYQSSYNEKNEGYDPDIESEVILQKYDIWKVKGLEELSDNYKLPLSGITKSLYRAWVYYSEMGRIRIGFHNFMENYVKNFESLIYPWAVKYYNMMADLQFLPNTPTLMNAGLLKPLLSGCFVLPVEDDLVSILNTCRDAALIHKAGGGTGFSFSRLRPRKDMVDGRPSGASGPVSFMKVYNATTGEIKQGYSRRGANMGVLSVHHPDILEFINCKIPPKGAVYVSPDDVPFSNFNISVAVTDNFMDAMKNGKKYDLINPRTGGVVKRVDARVVWKRIVHNAWENGDPGVVFIDEMNRYNPTPSLGDYESTNPCGEQVLLPNESCNLGAINLNQMFHRNQIDFVLFEDTIQCAIRFLNGIVDMNWFPLNKIWRITRGNRKIGLGIMGFADALYRMEIPYNDVKATGLGRRIAETLTRVSRESSRELGIVRGPFPNYKNSIYFEDDNPPFNAALTTIAPTGTTGIIANSASGGIEPVTYLKFSRWIFEGGTLEGINQVFMETIERNKIDGHKILEHVKKYGTINDINPEDFYTDPKDMEKFRDLQMVFKVAHDISYDAHVRMQAAFQEHIDSSISKTINFPEDATEEDVESAFLLAHTLKCKGITIYRDGSKDWQVVSLASEKIKDQATSVEPISLPDDLPARRIKVETGCGNIHLIISYDPITKKPLEMFVEMGKSGGCAYAWAHALGRLTSIQLRSGIPVDEIISQLKNIQCPEPLSGAVSKKNEKIYSCVDAIAITLRDFSVGMNGTNGNKIKDKESRKECPKCGSGQLIHSEGCVKCHNCNWSKCS